MVDVDVVLDGDDDVDRDAATSTSSGTDQDQDIADASWGGGVHAHVVDVRVDVHARDALVARSSQARGAGQCAGVLRSVSNGPAPASASDVQALPVQ